MSKEPQGSAPITVPTHAPAVHTRSFTEPPLEAEYSSSNDLDPGEEASDQIGPGEHSASDATGSRRNYDDPHSEPDTVGPSPAALAANSLGGTKKAQPRRRHESSSAGRHNPRPEPTHRSKKGDSQISWRFKSDKEAAAELIGIIREKEQTINEIDDKLYRSEKSNRKLLKEISDLAQENDRLQSEIEHQDSQIRTVQDHQLRKVGVKGFVQAEDDGQIRQKLRALTSRWRSWAREYSISSMDQISSADVAKAEPTFKFIGVPEELLHNAKHAAIAPGIILHASLSKYVTAWIIRQPFFCLHDGRSGGDPAAVGADISHVFNGEYQRLLKLHGDPSAIHAWRSQTLQLLDTPEHESRSHPEVYQDSLRRKESFYHFLRKGFDKNHGFLYRRDNASQRERELYSILHSTGEIFSSLWKQKVNIESRLSHYYHAPFSMASQEMEAHPAQRLEDGDTRMDGCPVRMVVQPAVLAFGNEDGKDYDVFKVWSKALVWLGSSATG